MSKEHKLAIERILALCEKTNRPTNTIKRVMDIALQASGLTETQRKIEIQAMCERAFQRQRDHAEKKWPKAT